MDSTVCEGVELGLELGEKSASGEKPGFEMGKLEELRGRRKGGVEGLKEGGLEGGQLRVSAQQGDGGGEKVGGF